MADNGPGAQTGPGPVTGDGFPGSASSPAALLVVRSRKSATSTGNGGRRKTLQESVEKNDREPTDQPVRRGYDGAMNETRQSLLLRARTGEEEAWKDLTDLYRPLIIGWLNRQGVPAGRSGGPEPGHPPERGQAPARLRALRPPGCVPLLAAHHRLQPHDRLLAGRSTRAPGPAAAAAPRRRCSRSPTPTAT